MQKIIKIFLIILGVVGIILWLLLPGRDVPADIAINNSNVNLMFVVSYILLAIPVLALVLYTIKNLISSPAKLKRALIAIAGLVVVLIISYALSSGTNVDLQTYANRGIDVDESSSKWIGTGLYSFYVLTIIAVGAMLFGGIKKILSK
ncbi:hypothetical protein GTQ40_14360 [Flavobacteriaceae bacterium R38]|nr:hypothetical protein [Flavobacteriaceae bacterium R38]